MKTRFFLQIVLDLPSFGFYSNSANVVAEIQFKLLNERALSTGETCTFEYASLLQSFHRGAISITWYIAQTF